MISLSDIIKIKKKTKRIKNFFIKELIYYTKYRVIINKTKQKELSTKKVLEFIEFLHNINKNDIYIRYDNIFTSMMLYSTEYKLHFRILPKNMYMVISFIDYESNKSIDYTIEELQDGKLINYLSIANNTLNNYITEKSLLYIND